MPRPPRRNAVLALTMAAAPLAAQETDGQKYVVTWHERPAGSAAEYEGAQARILELFQGYQIPDSIEVHEFVVRVGEYGGTMIVTTDDLAALHGFTSVFAAFAFDVAPVLEIGVAVPAEIRAIEYRGTVDGAD